MATDARRGPAHSGGATRRGGTLVTMAATAPGPPARTPPPDDAPGAAWVSTHAAPTAQGVAPSRGAALPAPGTLTTDATVTFLHAAVPGWYATHRRELPWRAPGVSAYAILVSEVMLQQTPVARVEPHWRTWLDRWPTPVELAAASPADVLRAWGRLGYPRRALRLLACARTIVDRHHGRVPKSVEDLVALPGVGPYTAAAVAVFAYQERAAVLDTNVRRVVARVLDARAAAPPHQTRAELRRAEDLLPADAGAASTWSVALMELGALVCTARAPACDGCPVRVVCAWRTAGFPAPDGPRRAPQPWDGTDRQARGRLLGALRAADESRVLPPGDLAREWPPDEQRERALASLLADGLVEMTPDGYRLPGP